MSRPAALTAATAALAVVVAGLAAAAPASGATRTITMNGAPITKSLVADLAYFYRHQHRRAPRFTLAGGGTSDFVERNPAAFAYVDLALTETLHVLTFDGVGCTRATVRNGRYLARRPLGIVTRGRPRGELRKFLRWVRTSRTARRVIATRYIPA